MNIAIVLAGGLGNRMNNSVPKQFLKVYGKPVLIYTLESFQQHPQIDAIEVVCLEGWQTEVLNYIKQYELSKVRWVVAGGMTVQESIRNGVFFLENKAEDEDIIVIHDGVRPLVDSSVLADAISVCRQYGNAVSALPFNEQIFVADCEDTGATNKYIPREMLRRVSTPQAYSFGILDEKYHEAFEKSKGIHGASYTNTMMAELGVKLHFSAGSDKNIKLTTKEDLEIFKSILYYSKSDRTNEQN